MFKKILLSVFLFVLSTSITKADTEHTLGALQNMVKGFAYIGTLFSWLILYEILAKDKRKLIIFSLIITIICGLIGIEAINSGNNLSGYDGYKESADSKIYWGWAIITMNVLPNVIAIVRGVVKDIKEESIKNNLDNNQN